MVKVSNQQSYIDFKAKQELAEEANREKVVEKELSKGERLKRSLVYFWMYHKWYVIIPLIVVIVLGSLIGTIIVNSIKPFFSMILVNVIVADDSEFVNSINEFNEIIHTKGISDKDMTYKDNYRHPTKNDPEYLVDYDVNSSTQKLSSELTSDLVDVLIVNTRCADEFNDSNSWEPIDNVISAEDLNKIDEKYYYYGEIDNKKQIIGISVDAFSKLSDLKYREGDTYIVVVSKFSTRKNIATEYFKFMLED